MDKSIILFNNFYKESKDKINILIDKYNKELTEDKNGYLKANLELFSNLNSGGKLIRGILIALGYKLTNKRNIEYSYPLSLAFELFQTSVLIHDDIIDEDNLRRGKETIHFNNYKNNKKYNPLLAKKIGDSIAICIGSYGFHEANKQIIKNYKNDKKLSKILDYYNDIVLKTIEGELVDVELSFDGRYRLKDVNLYDNIMTIYKLKTAYYTIIGPINLGLILGGASEDKLKDIELFGEKIGIAFQIQDDILGIYNNLGKEKGSDIREYKQTLLFSYTINTKYKDELLKYYGKENINNEEIELVKNIFIDSGAYDYANKFMNKLYDEALETLDNIKWIKKNDKLLLTGFINYLRNRNR